MQNLSTGSHLADEQVGRLPQSISQEATWWEGPKPLDLPLVTTLLFWYSYSPPESDAMGAALEAEMGTGGMNEDQLTPLAYSTPLASLTRS